tara:strand:+ start:121 stop:444 length:324 start_codon:yes stop_codon:yes gene_type:complete
LGERLLCKQEVIGSIPFTSTKLWWMRAERRCRNEDRSRRGRVTEVTERFGRYWFPAFAGEEMFDIVNREYEENGSFRCDFSQRKNVIAILAVLCIGRVLPLRKTQNS